MANEKKKSKKGTKVRKNVKEGTSSTNPHVIMQDMEPKPKYSMGRPSKYDNSFHPLIAAFMARDGWTVNQMLDEFGITTTAFYAWMEKHPDFRNAVNNGRDFVDKQVENALLKSALGFCEEWEETTTTYGGVALCIPGEAAQEIDGTFIETERRVTKKKQVFKPDVAAIKFWLVNRKDANWKSDTIKVKHNHNGPVDGEPVTVKPDLTGLSMAELQELQRITGKIEGKKK